MLRMRRPGPIRMMRLVEAEPFSGGLVEMEAY